MKSTLTIGRSSNCDIIIPNGNVSRVHARISIVGGQYVFEDVGKNGSVIGGRIIHGQRISVAAGTQILLAGKIPLPWAQVYSMLPLQGVCPSENETSYNYHEARQIESYSQENRIGVGWGILSFLIPIAGWIMYFVWRDQFPHKASQANKLAWIGFSFNVISCLFASL